MPTDLVCVKTYCYLCTQAKAMCVVCCQHEIAQAVQHQNREDVITFLFTRTSSIQLRKKLLEQFDETTAN